MVFCTSSQAGLPNLAGSLAFHFPRSQFGASTLALAVCYLLSSTVSSQAHRTVIIADTLVNLAVTHAWDDRVPEEDVLVQLNAHVVASYLPS